MNRSPAIVAACSGAAILAMSLALLYAPDETDHVAAINKSIDAFHQAAADADLDAYFDLMTEDARFLGTDPAERWTKAEFPPTARTAAPSSPPPGSTPQAPRAVDLDPNAETAWFDLLAHDRYGILRGSGVLTKAAGTNWKIAQYNLTFLVPNEKTPGISLPSPPSARVRGLPILPPLPRGDLPRTERPSHLQGRGQGEGIPKATSAALPTLSPFRGRGQGEGATPSSISPTLSPSKKGRGQGEGTPLLPMPSHLARRTSPFTTLRAPARSDAGIPSPPPSPLQKGRGSYSSPNSKLFRCRYAGRRIATLKISPTIKKLATRLDPP